MDSWNRRDVLKALVASVAAWPAASTTKAVVPNANAATSRFHLPHGYLLVQEVATFHASRYGAIGTAAEAERLFSYLESRGVNGVEYGTLHYDEQDLRAHEAIAKVASKHHVDLWKSTFLLTERASIFGRLPDEFQAYVMGPDGRIVPAPLIDVLNPDAVDWLCQRKRGKYFEPMKGLLSGIFFNEDCLPYMAEPSNDHRYRYWRNATYSPRVLQMWQEYCRKNQVTDNRRLVDKFPVHDAAMVAKSEGRAAFYPGWNVPAVIQPGQPFVSLPRATGVWHHWFEFTCEAFVNNWIGRLAQMATEVNAAESDWKGNIYFGLHHWSLPYEQIHDPRFTVPVQHHWGAWGRQRGLDLTKVAAHPDVDAIICETFPPCAANLEGFVAEFARITKKAGKTFGVMLHRDDHWTLKLDEEPNRWAILNKYKPTVIARYPRAYMFPGNEYYSSAGESLFDQMLALYRKSGSHMRNG